MTFRDDTDSHPPLDYPGYKSTRAAAPEAAADRAPAAADRDHRAGARRGPPRRARPRPHAPARGRADRPADHRPRPRQGGRRAARCPTRWSRSGRPTPAAATATAGTTGRAPIDPNFTGVGRCMTDDEGYFRFVTIRPGAYPWGNHANAWRPAHIHFSLFGRAFTQRLVTQMYFPDDPLFFQDPMYNSVARPRRAARADDQRLRLRRRPRSSGRSRSAGTSCCAARRPRRPRSRTHDARPRRPSARTWRSGCRGRTGRTSCRRARRAASASTASVFDGAGDADPRRADRDLAGRRRRQFGTGLPRLRPRADRRRRRLGDLHRQARRDRRRPGAAHRRQRVRPRACSTAASRGSTSPTRTTAAIRCSTTVPEDAARHAARRARRATATASTSTCRARVRPSSSASDVFAGVLARGGVAEQVSGRAWLQALLDFEAALARAQARAGVITARAGRARSPPLCDADRFDVGRDRRRRGRDRQPGGRGGARR